MIDVTTERVPAFRLQVPDEPGELQAVTEALAEAGVNINGLGGLTAGGRGTVELVPDRAGPTRRALDGAGVRYEEVQAVIVDVPDEPGALDGKLAKLAGEDVNVEAVFPLVGVPTRLAFTVDDPKRAQDLLGR